MNDPLELLKHKRKELLAELSRVERAITALTPDKLPGKKLAPKPAAVAAQKPEPPSPVKLPDRIVKDLLENGYSAAKTVADRIVAPESQVATTLSRMVKTGRLKKRESTEGVTLYGVDVTREDDGVTSPFEGTN